MSDITIDPGCKAEPAVAAKHGRSAQLTQNRLATGKK